MNLSRCAIAAIVALSIAAGVSAAQTGNVKLDVLGDIGSDARNAAQLIDRNGKVAGEVRPGHTIALAPGEYQMVLPIVGGKIMKDSVMVEAGRTSTVMIDNVAVLQVDAKDASGKDPGLQVTVTSPTPPHEKLTGFVSGAKYLFAPAAVDVHVDAPPQGYDWHAVPLKPGQRAHLSLTQVVPGELDVQTVLHGATTDDTRVIVFTAGTQNRVAESKPGSPHHFKLDPGDYDVYVENASGKGRPTASAPGIRLDPGAKVERTVPLD